MMNLMLPIIPFLLLSNGVQHYVSAVLTTECNIADTVCLKTRVRYKTKLNCLKDRSSATNATHIYDLTSVPWKKTWKGYYHNIIDNVLPYTNTLLIASLPGQESRVVVVVKPVLLNILKSILAKTRAVVLKARADMCVPVNAYIHHAIIPSCRGRVLEDFNGYDYTCLQILRHNLINLIGLDSSLKSTPSADVIIVNRSQSRIIGNLNDLAARFVTDGYSVEMLRDSEEMSRIIQMFWRAKIVIMYHGAAMANLIFCQNKVTVVEITRIHHNSDVWDKPFKQIPGGLGFAIPGLSTHLYVWRSNYRVACIHGSVDLLMYGLPIPTQPSNETTQLSLNERLQSTKQALILTASQITEIFSISTGVTFGAYLKVHTQRVCLVALNVPNNVTA